MVRPIEITDLMSKTSAAEKVNQIQKAAPEMDQRQFALQLNERLVERRQAPEPTTRSDEAVIHRDGQQKQDDQQKQKKKKDAQNQSGVQLHIDLQA